MFALYRKGDTHVVDGVKCEIVRVALGDLDQYRSEGWVDDIEDLDPKAKKARIEREKAEAKRLEEEAAAKLKAEAEAKELAELERLEAEEKNKQQS